MTSIEEVEEAIRNFSVKPKKNESRDAWIKRIRKDEEHIISLYNKLSPQIKEEYDILYHQLDGISDMVDEALAYGICEECIKFTSVFKGAQFFPGTYDQYNRIEEPDRFICPRCQKKEDH